MRIASRSRNVALAVLWLALAVVVLAQAPRAPQNVTIVAPSPFAPGLTLLSPSSGIVGATVTITGTNMGASQGVATVTFNGTTATASAWTATSLTVTVPVGTTTGSVVVSRGSLVSNSLTFTVTTGGVTNPIAAIRQPAGDASVPQSVWSTAGVVGGIPSASWNNCTAGACATLCPGVATTGTPTCSGGTLSLNAINNAVTAAGTNQRVWMPAGSATIGGINIGKSDLVLKGQGANSTILRINSISPVGCHLGFGQLLNICTGGGNIGLDSPDHTATWTAASYAQGQTTITLSVNPATNGLAVGQTIWLDQTDEPSPGFPASGDIWQFDLGGENYTRSGRGQLEGHFVTAINGSVLTIEPGLMMPNWRLARSPGAWWGNSGTVVHNVGVEDFTITDSGQPSAVHLMVINGTNVWAKGMRILSTGTVSTETRLTYCVNCFHVEWRDSYFYGPLASQVVSIYGTAPAITSLFRFENNVVTCSINPIVTDSTSFGSVFSFNVVEGCGIGTEQASIIWHAQGAMNLMEGNQFQNVSADNIHASHFFDTMYRNHLDGGTRNTEPNESDNAMVLYAVARFYNAVGNVIGASNWTTYQRNCPTQSCPLAGAGNPDHSAEWLLGWGGSNSNAYNLTGNDTHVNRTLFRWGNWDAVTSTNDNGSNDSTGTKFDTAEVPSAITSYANPVPSTQTIPASLLYASKPTFVGAGAWPLIGPDVTSSTIVTRTGGHANKIPAKLCFDAMASDTTNFNGSSPPVKAFTVAACPYLAP